MSYAQNNYSRYPSKNDVNPAQPGGAPLLYNTAHHGAPPQQSNQQPQWNSGAPLQQPQPYWQSNQHQQYHHHQQQQQQHQPQPATTILHPHNQNTLMQNSQWSAAPSSDPWNWGEDDNSTPAEPQPTPAPVAAPVNAEAAWDWGVQPPAPPASQFPPRDNYYVQQPAAPSQHPVNNNAAPATDADYTPGYFYPPHQPGQHLPTTEQTYQNSPAVNENDSQTGNLEYNNTNSGNYFVQQSSEQLNAPSLVKYQNSTVLKNEIPNGGAGFNDVGNLHVQQHSNQFDDHNATNFAPPVNSFQNVYQNNTDVVGYARQNQDTNYRKPPDVPTLETSDGGAQNLEYDHAASLEVDAASLTGNDVSEESRDNASEVSGSSARHNHYALRDDADFEYLNPTGATTGNKGLAAQWSTESLHSQGSDDVSQSSNHNEKAYQYDSYSSYADSPGALRGEERPRGAVLTEELLCDRMGEMQVANADREARGAFVENAEQVGADLGTRQTVMPPTVPIPAKTTPPPSFQAPLQSVPPPSKTTPPPNMSTPSPSVLMPPPGPPKAQGGVSENPYSGSRVAPNSRYRVPNLSASSSSSSSEQVNYNVFMQPPQTPLEPAAEPYGSSMESDSINLETLPENKEQPDAVLSAHRTQSAALVAPVERKSASPMPSGQRVNPPAVGQDSSARQWVQEAPYTSAPDNQEVSVPGRCGPDRNQYLETGQLSEEDPRGWPGLQRMVPGEGQLGPDDPGRQFNEATPPPGLHRMVPGQVTEHDSNRVSQFTDDQSQDSNDDVLLRRMVPGQVTPEQPQRVGDIPLPLGLRRMVPGESSSPESQAAQPGSRVVTGDGREEADSSYAAPQMAQTAAAPSTGPAPTQPTAGERSETIGSDSVETYPPPQPDNTQRDVSSNRRDAGKHDRDRHHRDNESAEESDGRRRVKKDYRGRDRDDSSGGGRRFKGDARKGERDRHGNRLAAEERRPPKEHRSGERRGRQDASDSDNYSSDQYGRYKRRDKSTDSRRYERGGREERGGRDERGGRQYETRDGYGRDSRNEREAYNKSRRGVEPRGSDSEFNSDYDRRQYDRKGYVRRRDYEHHSSGKARYREDYEYRRRYPGHVDASRHRGPERAEAERSRYETSFREKGDHRPDSRGHQSRMYPPEQQTYLAGPKPQYTAEYYAYYQQLRTTDPVAYAEWYNTVYTRQIYPHSVSYSEDRGSVHSGRSSDNNNAYRERDGRPETTDPPASSTPQRLTPTFFSTPHVKGTLTNRGQLVKVLPNYPLDGQSATVEILDVQGLCVNNQVRDELVDFPGPLIKGSTHKNSIIAFCQRRIAYLEADPSIVDRDSAILLWQLLILLVKQNGNVVGPDISELLLTSRPASVSVKRSSVSSRSSHHGSSHHGSQQGLDEAAADSAHHPAKFNVRSEEEVTTAFRDYLLYGNVKEALEWAMRNGLWGHALFLASKTDARQHANVMMRFANGLPFNDPLQTLYQIKSGRQPLAVTGCIDEKFGSWKPHLAMILANPSTPEVDHKAIMTLGDTLATRGCLFAAHFTYLMAQTEFAPYSQRATAKLVLIGSPHHHRGFHEFASNEAIQMTEVYEYASRLADPDNAIPSFQWFKYVYAQRLVEQNLTSDALLYVEEVSKVLLLHPDLYDPGLFKQVYELGDQLKYRDPLYTNGSDDTAELPWLVELQQALRNFNLGLYSAPGYPSHESTLNHSYSEADHSSHQADHHHHQQQQQHQQLQQEAEPPAAAYDPMVASDGYETALSDEGSRYTQYVEQQQWQQPQQQWQQTTEHDNTQVYEPLHAPDQSQSQSSYQNQWEENTQADEPQPQISLPNSYSERKEKPAAETEAAPQSPAKTKPRSPQSRGKPAGNGWFGGIWNKLSLKPKNQMILPEDKNPTIVWDPDRKRWVNMDADGEEVSTELAPPPKASDMPGAFPAAAPAYAPAPAPNATRPKENGGPASLHTPAPAMANGSAVNKYKLNNKGKSFRSNYVDVFGSSKMAPQTAPPPGLFPLMAGGTQSIFTPGPSVESAETESSLPANDGMYETPQRHPSDVQAPREVFAPNVSDNRSAYTGPMMYDPRTYSQHNAAQSNANQYQAH